MAITPFPYGLSSFGMPILPGPGVMPNLAAGQVPSGAPAGYSGVLFVCGDTGSDANDGLTPSTPLKNLDTAYNKTAGSRNEVIYLIGGSAAVTFTSAIGSGGLVWSKSFTHLVGLASGVMIGSRARITNGASTNLMTPMITVSGSGCLFQNLEMFQGGDDATAAAVCLLVTGSRNHFDNCQISGGGVAASAGNAAMRSLVVTGSGGENLFSHCYIGLDTINRTSTSSEIEFTAGTTRNIFEGCVISTLGSGSQFFVTIGASGIDRFVLYRNCQFINAFSLSGATLLTNAFSLDGACGGAMLLASCLILGATATSATKTDLYFDNAYASTTTAKALVAGW